MELRLKSETCLALTLRLETGSCWQMPADLAATDSSPVNGVCQQVRRRAASTSTLLLTVLLQLVCLCCWEWHTQPPWWSIAVSMC
jgi:hypothetical protein